MSSKGTDHDLRVSRVAKAIRDIIANAVIRGLRDVPRGPVTVTRVDVTRDFKQAKVYVSIFIPDDKSKAEAEDMIARILFAFEDGAHELATQVNKQLRLKNVPMFEFVHDTGLEKMGRMAAILDGIRPATEGDPSRGKSGADKSQKGSESEDGE